MAVTIFDSLPPEIFCRMLYLGFREEMDLEFLWNECRNVSKFWRLMVEDFVRKRHLPKTTISYDVGTDYFVDVLPFILTR